MSLLSELRRRNVFRVALFYLIAAWLVVQIAETVLPVFDVPDVFVRGIIVVLVIGFVPALVFAWAFELTPDGLKRDKHANVDPVTKQQTAQKLNVATLTAAVLAIGLLLADRMLPEPPAPRVAEAPALQDDIGDASGGAESNGPDAASIAVLPFADLSRDRDQEYFSDGIAEEILNVLVDVDGLAVASRTSSFQFKSREAMGIPAIADELGVRHVLEGSLRKDGDSIRITAQLIDAPRDLHLWSETWDRELTSGNLFAIQDEIATAIVASIQSNLGIEIGDAAAIPQRTGNIDAYGLFLEARTKYHNRSDLTEAARLLGRAVDLDPEFEDAWALLAAVQAISPQYDYVVPGADGDAYDLARRSAQRALELDERNALAIGVFGLLQLLEINEGLRRHSYIRLVESFDRALALEPNNLSLLNWRGNALNGAARFERSLVDFERCAELEPAYAVCRSNIAAANLALGRFDDARQALFDAAAYGAFVRNGTNLAMLADLGERRLFHFVAAAVPQLDGWHAMDDLYQALRTPEQSHEALADRLLAFFERSDNFRGDARNLLIPLGRLDHPPFTNAIWLPAYRVYRQTPLFKDVLRQRGIVEYWQATGWPDSCRPITTAAGEEDFECD